VLDTVTEKDFQEAFLKWRRRWDRCLLAGGNYFEGDGGRKALWWVLWFLQHQSGIFWICPRKWHDFQEEVTEFKMCSDFVCDLSQTFLILRKSERI
jgi:hypothetical protein